MRLHHSPELGLARTKAMAGFCLKEFAQPPYRRLPWHEHREASICFVVSGAYAERMRARDHECPPHSMVFKPAGERHADEFGPEGGTCLLIEVVPERLRTLEPVSDVAARPSLVRNAKVAALGYQIYREFLWSDDLSPLAVEGLVLEVLVEAARAGRERPARPRPQWLRQAVDLIHERAGQPLTLSSIAREVGIHPAHLARTFRAHYRRSIGDYVRRLRVERAARDLSDAGASIAEIGIRAGFFDQSHFSRVFREHTGLTPTAFRSAARAHSRTNPQRSS
jgi:AraC family transcriptional regulator